MTDTTSAHEIAQATEIGRLRSALARIDGAASFNATAAINKHERAAFAMIADMAREALDATNAASATVCPDEPSRCGYQEYLAYRKDGESDLGHDTYHAAMRLAEQHAASCKVYESGRTCPTCLSHEQRVRA